MSLSRSIRVPIVRVVDKSKRSPFGFVNYTPILACQQDITLLEYLRNWTQNRLKVNNLVSGATGASGNNSDKCYFGSSCFLASHKISPPFLRKMV